MSTGGDSSSDLAAFTARVFQETGGWLLLLFGSLGALSGLREAAQGSVVPGILVLVFSVLFVLAGAVVAPSVRKRVDHRHSPTAFGRTPVVERRVIRPEENCYEQCVVCGSRVEGGLVRRYREDIAFAGIPLVFGSNSYNHYCLDCAREEMGDVTRATGPATGVVDYDGRTERTDEEELETESA